MKYAVTGLLILISFLSSGQTKQAVIEVVQLKALHYKAPCWGEGIGLCYLIERKEDEIHNFYDSIEGFEYEWGYNYNLIVEKFKIVY